MHIHANSFRELVSLPVCESKSSRMGRRTANRVRVPQGDRQTSYGVPQTGCGLQLPTPAFRIRRFARKAVGREAVNWQEQIKGLVAERLDLGTAEMLAAELARPATAPTIVQLLDELGEASRKAKDAAVDALPDLHRRVGFECVVKWLDLGVMLSGTSGAATIKYFRESPLVLGLIESAGARERVLDIALEVADSDPNVALDFLRRSPELLTVLAIDELESWAQVGLELAQANYVVGIEFFQQSPAVAAVLPLGEVRSWAGFGMKLITQNTLGKPDYLGTLEFFRTSPAILRDIESAPLRPLVVSLGNQIAERNPAAAIAFLAESPVLLRRVPAPRWAQLMLQYGLLVAERDADAALHYLRRCPEILALFGDEDSTRAKFEEWFKGGMEILEYSAEGARAYFALETRNALQSVERAVSGVPLRQIARSLKLFVQGLCGAEVTIQSLPEPGRATDAENDKATRPVVSPDGRTLSLPAILRRYPTREENLRLYTVMAAHEAGHLEFGTYRLSLAQLGDFVTELRQRYRRSSEDPSPHPVSLRGEGPQEGTVHTLHDLFALYPQPGLVRDLWTVLEDARVEFLLRSEYPGLRNDLAALANEAVKTRSLLHGMSVREMVVDALLLLTTAEAEPARIPDAIADVVERVWSMAQSLFRRGVTAEETVRLADRIYVSLESMLETGVAAEEGRGEPETEAGMGPSAAETLSDQYRPITNWSYRGAMNPDTVALSGVEDQSVPHKDRGDTDSNAGGLAGLAEAVSDRVRDQENQLSRKEGLEVSGGESTPSPSPDSVADQILAVGDDRRGRHQEPGGAQRCFTYDEWDPLLQDYRTQWCQVVEESATEGTAEFADRVLSEHGPSVRLLRRYFEAIRPPGLRRMKGQAEGEDLDLEAVIKWRADTVAGAEPDDRIYVRRERRERDVAVAFLVDLSGSTSRQIESGGRRVIDVEKESLVLLTEALEALGDQYAVYGYSGRGRRHVEFRILKDFEEPSRGRALHRIGAVTPLHQNRDGAAIRHAVYKLRARSAKVRLLVLISDGKPLDDGYAEEYSLEDTRMALREARTQGIEPFCITVDREADDYLRRMYGNVRYLIIDHIASLPDRLPRIYQRLTA